MGVQVTILIALQNAKCVVLCKTLYNITEELSCIIFSNRYRRGELKCLQPSKYILKSTDINKIRDSFRKKIQYSQNCLHQYTYHYPKVRGWMYYSWNMFITDYLFNCSIICYWFKLYKIFRKYQYESTRIYIWELYALFLKQRLNSRQKN